MGPERIYAALGPPDGRTLAGPAVVYSDVARVDRYRLQIMPGAFAPLPADVALNVQHDRAAIVARIGAGLELQDGPDQLRMAATLPATPRADQALADVKAGLLLGISAELVVARQTVSGGLRKVEKATLTGLALVDTPAFPQSEIEAMAARIAAEQTGGWRRAAEGWL
ncbi:MAG: HK97 family phage prohead protease [Chloroflexi bacterium]|nr:HK97 family phage prohead protease [Chloroflexota bacterium]